jgi:hypothetical protein
VKGTFTFRLLKVNVPFSFPDNLKVNVPFMKVNVPFMVVQ